LAVASNPLAGKDRIRVLFLRPPRHFWPILNESDNFLLPLGYPALAAWLRVHLPGVELELYDCCATRTGWASLRSVIEERKPDVLCVGEKTIYYKEGLKAFELAKSIDPNMVTIGGGHMYSNLPEWTMEQCSALDFIGLFEGEITLTELLETLREDGDVSAVKGICYRDGERIVVTPARPTIEDLDTLPIPAYDLSNLHLYAPFGNLWPRAVTIQRSRGCIDECSFCSWWVQEGSHELKDGKFVHTKFYRTKSVERTIEEVELLYEKYGIRYLFWVDATWNVDERWLAEFCEEIIRRDYKLGWWAFTRADGLVRQHEKGVLKLMARAGLRHVLLGAERSETIDFDYLKKTNYSHDIVKQAFNVLRDHYPEVFRQGTFITGLRRDTAESIRALLSYAHECDVDFAAFHPITPFPGTPMWAEARTEGWIEEQDYENYDMFYPVMATEHLSREEISRHTQWCQQNFVSKRPLRYFSRMLSPHPIRRRLHRWFTYAIGRVVLRDLAMSMRGQKQFEGFAAANKLWKPGWYNA